VIHVPAKEANKQLLFSSLPPPHRLYPDCRLLFLHHHHRSPVTWGRKSIFLTREPEYFVSNTPCDKRPAETRNKKEIPDCVKSQMRRRRERAAAAVVSANCRNCGGTRGGGGGEEWSRSGPHLVRGARPAGRKSESTLMCVCPMHAHPDLHADLVRGK
jgi:hypothetical protein